MVRSRREVEQLLGERLGEVLDDVVLSDDADEAHQQFADVKRARLLMLLRQSGQITVDRTFGDDELASFECRTERAGKLAATAQISVYRRRRSGEEP